MARARDLAVDRLSDPRMPVEVLVFDGATFGEDAGGAREPHRHDYHELFWARSGSGVHLIDGRPSAMRAGTMTLIGRGQVHVLERARELTGAVVRFRDEILYEGPGARANPAWLLGSRGERAVDVPASELARVQAAVDTLAAETRRPADACSADLQRHFLSGLLLWIERWYDAARSRRREADDADVQLYRRFVQVLERDFARHHVTGHYADALAVPPAAVSRALAAVTGRATKEHITDRVMLEAARLLAFTELSVKEIAHRAGYGDPLYFSRAFKRHYGESPMGHRARTRGVVRRRGPAGCLSRELHPAQHGGALAAAFAQHAEELEHLLASPSQVRDPSAGSRVRNEYGMPGGPGVSVDTRTRRNGRHSGRRGS